MAASLTPEFLVSDLRSGCSSSSSSPKRLAMPETLGSRFPFRCFFCSDFFGKAPKPSFFGFDFGGVFCCCCCDFGGCAGFDPDPAENRSDMPLDCEAGAGSSSSSSPVFVLPNNDATPPKLCCRVPPFAPSACFFFWWCFWW